MTRLIIHLGLIFLFACSSRPATEERAIVASAPNSATKITITSDTVILEGTSNIPRVRQKETPKRPSHTKSETDTIKTAPPIVRVKKILCQLDTKPFQTYTLTGSKDTTITLEQGTTIRIPSESFINEKTGQHPKGEVKLVAKEYYELSDILLANLTTTTKTEILETGGMIYINAYDGADTLVPSKEIEIHFPFKDKIDGMQLFTGNRDASGVMIWEKAIEENQDADPGDSVYTIVEKMPEFPGGYSALRKHINSKLRYPSEAIRQGIQGTVYVTLVIEANGEVSETSVVRGVTESLNQAALKAVANMPPWKPASVEKRHVCSSTVLPIHFSLDGVGLNGSSRPGTTYNVALRRYFEENVDNALLPKVNANVVTNYVLSSSRLGWINCDRFIEIKRKTNTSKADFEARE